MTVKEMAREVEHGRNSCSFIPYEHAIYEDYFEEVKAKYESVGYVIKPTGYIGGVWQRTMDIIW